MRRRWLCTGVALGAIGLMLAPVAVTPRPRLLWNASASVPIGLYVVRPPGSLHVGDLAVARPPAALARYLDARRSLPLGVPLVKLVAALTPQRVCRFGAGVSIDGAAVAMALAHDRRGRSMPVWQGCFTLASDEVFLLNPGRPDSLDGRYFGRLPLAVVVGRAAPLWIPRAP
ncbi:S26 family signal peptidase [Caulobacter sp. S45]|uniref:S26 family signal peptidase n=1 Tax=Caulobacter sp. S45 TaxID=1641861 RepID=UPI00131D6214|nr:S26 family signal peptidase [Caulobacter sp. S45]